MSFWRGMSLGSQRHHVMDAARTYKAALAEQRKRYEAHQQALEALQATGAELVYTSRPHGSAACIRLPTESHLEAANHRVHSSWAEFCTALAECPAVQSEVFAMLGCP